MLQGSGLPPALPGSSSSGGGTPAGRLWPGCSRAGGSDRAGPASCLCQPWPLRMLLWGGSRGEALSAPKYLSRVESCHLILPLIPSSTSSEGTDSAAETPKDLAAHPLGQPERV